MNINNLGDELTPSNSTEIELLNNSIDNVISDIRAVYRDLIPRELSIFGLNKALTQFCNTSSETTKLKLTLESYYNAFFKNQTNELIYFRLFKEVLNNIMKHSKATIIDCKIQQNGNVLTTTYLYNGKGTSNSEIEDIKKNTTGIGLSSIDSRLMVLNGHINYTTIPQGNLIKITIHNNGL